MKLSPRQVVYCFLACVASYGLAVPALFITGTILLDLRLVTGGLLAWSGLFAVIFLGIGAMIFVIAIPALYAEGLRRGWFRRRFFTVLSIQLLVIPVLHALALIEHMVATISLVDGLIFCGGLGLGTVFVILAARAPSRRSLRAARKAA